MKTEKLCINCIYSIQGLHAWVCVNKDIMRYQKTRTNEITKNGVYIYGHQCCLNNTSFELNKNKLNYYQKAKLLGLKRNKKSLFKKVIGIFPSWSPA